VSAIAIVSFVNRPKGQSRGGMGAVMKYTMRQEKTMWSGMKLVSGVNCSPSTAYDDFISTKLLHHKEVGRMYYHMVQSFPKGEEVPPETAHEIALKLAAYFADYQVLVCTHVDREHIHSHFIINSVGMETGRKFHLSTPELEPLRRRSDELCWQYGLSVYEPQQQAEQVKGMGVAEYHAAAKGESWKWRLINVIDEAMKYAGSRAEFIELLSFEGYSVTWTPERKYVTYACPGGQKCRDNKLHADKYLKERMEDEFGIRGKIDAGRTETAESAGSGSGAGRRAPGHAGREELGGPDRPCPTAGSGAGGAAGPAGAVVDRRGCGEAFDLAGGAQPGASGAAAGGSGEICRTCWEPEREIFLRLGQADEQYGLGAPEYGSADGAGAYGFEGYGPELAAPSHAAGGGPADLADSAVQLAYALERMSDPEQPVQDATTRRIRTRKRKKGWGQKRDDHSGEDEWQQRL